MRWESSIYKLSQLASEIARRVRKRRMRTANKRVLRKFRKYCRDLGPLVRNPVFVKVGANDGLTRDPCSDILLSDERWTGLLIEPVPYCFERLRNNFSDSKRFKLDQIAIGTAGLATFYYVDDKALKSLPNLPTWFDQIGSFEKSHIVKHLGGVLEPFIVESTVKVFGLSEILTRHSLSKVHLLHVDTEGHDMKVLKTLDFSKHAPLVVFIEHKHLSFDEKEEMKSLLRNHGYSIADAGTDYFAVNEKEAARIRGSNVLASPTVVTTPVSGIAQQCPP